MQNCFLNKMVYLNINYVIATRNYDSFNTGAVEQVRYHTVERYYTCSCSKLRHQTHQKVCKYSLTFPLKNGIVTVSFTIK